MLIECANGEKMGSNARRSPPSDYLLPMLYTSCIEDYIRSMEGDLPIFSMFPSPAEATDASWRETNSSGLERDTPNHSQEQPHESVSLHSAHDLTLPMLSASPDIAGLPTLIRSPELTFASWSGYAATRVEPCVD
ncbi:hypothetical protein PMIN04_007914 [Paraphaeosphaeria minitans]